VAQREPTNVKNLDGYGNDALPWSRVSDYLNGEAPSADIPYFLSTINPDGTPHSNGVGALWLDGDVYFTSNLDTRKARNLADNPACTISGRLPGLDVVFEGTAHKVTDPEILEAAAKRYNEGGWPTKVEGGAFTAPFSAPSAGPPPWYVYRLDYHTVFGVATAEPNGATKWEFAR
jgi:hypothetical protein